MTSVPSGSDRSAAVELDTYERDNLLSLIEAVSGWAGSSPLGVGNTGDWLMQVAFKLGWEGEATDRGHPNVSAAELVLRAERARATRAEEALGRVRDLAAAWLVAEPAGFYPEATEAARTLNSAGEDVLAALDTEGETDA